MMKRIYILIGVFFSLQGTCQVDCSAPFAYYDEFTSVSFNEMINTLDTYYSLDQTNYDNNKSNSDFGLALPDYGTLTYKQNKSRISKLNKKIEAQTNYSLSLDDRLFIYQKTALPRAFDSFDLCVASTGETSYLTVQNSKKDFILTLDLRNARSNSKTKIISVVATNATFTGDGNLKSGKARFGESYSAKFTKDDPKMASYIAVNIKQTRPLSKTIEVVSDEPIYQTSFFKSDTEGKPYLYEHDFKVDPYPSEKVPKKIGGITFHIKKPARPKLFTFDIDLNDDTSKIYRVLVVPNNCNIQGDNFKSDITKDDIGTVSITSTTSSCNGKIYVYYEKIRKYCVKNCGD